MIICDHCFRDTELQAMIRSKSVKTGTCPTCHTENAHLLDTVNASDLSQYLESLLSIYRPVSQLPDGPYKDTCVSITEELSDRWHLFGNVQSRDKRRMIREICHDTATGNTGILDERVGIPELYDRDYVARHSLFSGHSWKDFVKQVKFVSRYHPGIINEELMQKYCSFIRRVIREGSEFYRARLSENKERFDKDSMGAPPEGKSSDGRANARGIYCLYLANDSETALHEIRASQFDYACIGKFRLTRDIVVADLRRITEISPFLSGIDFIEHAINREQLEKLNEEMGKTLRRNDDTLDYVTTQYLVDLIRSFPSSSEEGQHEYAGIIYNSTTTRDGYNLAIFEPDLFQCESIDMYRIDELNYKKYKME
jgi:hypothetical protein